MKKLSLIIQVYNGNNFFKECLDSVKQNTRFFHTIYISINKSAVSDFDLKTAMCFKEDIKQSSDNQNIRIIILSQSKTLSAINHGKIFYKNILKLDKTSDFFMILCHDDILLPSFADNISSILCNLNENEILNPARSYYHEGFTEKNYMGSYYGLISYPEIKTTKEDFAAKGLDCHHETNITGLIFSKKVLQKFYKVLPFFSYGYRAEYIMMFVPSIQYIQSTSVAVVGIRRHNEQAGAQFIKNAYEADERLYRFYMWYVTKNHLFKKQIQKDISFFEKNPYHFFKILYLHFICFWLTKSVYRLAYTLCMIPITTLCRIFTKFKKIFKKNNRSENENKIRRILSKV